MADLKKVTDDLTTNAALAAGKDAARRAVDDLLSTDEEKVAKENERAAASKSRRNKLIAYGAVGLLLLVGIFGMVVSYWQWFFVLGVVGVVGLYAWYRIRQRLAARKSGDGETDESEVAAAEPKAAALRVADEEPERVRDEAELRRARLVAERARQQTEALAEQEIEDELAAMKARLED
jgi:hypothetical protein